MQEFINDKEEAERAIKFMNPNSMDETERVYWELSRAKIVAQGGDDDVQNI
jgi:hypothetical protein